MEIEVINPEAIKTIKEVVGISLTIASNKLLSMAKKIITIKCMNKPARYVLIPFVGLSKTLSISPFKLLTPFF